MRDVPIVVLCTVPNQEVAAELARGLVEAKLAACVNVLGPVRSFYAWEGKIQDEQELQLVIKSRGGLFRELEHWIRAKHPYQVPEILALPIEAGSQPYL